MKKNIAFSILIVLCAEFCFGQTGKIVIPDGNSGFISQTIADRQGKYSYTADADKIVMWDIKTGEQLYTLLSGNDINQMAISPNGNLLAFANGTVVCQSTITGKLSFPNITGKGIAFSTDGSKLYTIYDGLIEIDAVTGVKNIISKDGFDNYEAKVWMVNSNTVAIVNRYGWQLWNLSSKQKLFEKKWGSENLYLYYLPTMKYIVVRKNAMYNDATAKFEFYNILNGDLIKKLDMPEGEAKFFAAENTNEFIISAGLYEGEKYLLYSADNFSLKKTFKPAFQITTAFFEGSGKQFLISNGANHYKYSLEKNSNLLAYTRQVVDLGAISPEYANPEYNYSSGQIKIITDDSLSKTIDIERMTVLQHVNLKKRSDAVCFTSTGDTVATFNGKNLVLKNTKSGLLIRQISTINEVETLHSNGFFFSPNGKSLYYLLAPLKNEGPALMKLDLVANTKEKLIQFNTITSLTVNADKTLLQLILSGFEKPVHRCRIYDLKTGKVTFEKDFNRMDEFGRYVEPDEIYIRIDADKTKVLLAHQDKFSLYSYPSGQALVDEVSFEKSASSWMNSLDKFGANGVSSNLNQFIIGSRNGDLVSFDGSGKKQFQIKAHLAAVRNILFANGNKIFYTLSYDQTIKAWAASTGELLGTLYLFNDGKDYVFVSKDGRFDGTPGGIKRLYYFDKRKKLTLDVVYERFYTPNLYQRLVNGEKFSPINININPSPLVKMSYEQKTRNLIVEEEGRPSYNNTTGVAEITINASAQDDKVEEMRLFHNGKIVSLATRGLFVTDNDGSDTKKYTINLLPGQNTFRAVALNSQRTESDPDEITVAYQLGNQPIKNTPNNTVGVTAIDAVDKNATLHLLVVGINKYQNTKMSLNYALADATAFKNEIEGSIKTVLGNVKTYFVTDEKADKNGITAAFAEVQKNAKAQDVFVFYYAGHGVISEKNKEFYLVPTDVIDLKNVDAALEQKGIPSKLLQTYAVDIQAQKQLFILDACQSAGAFETLMSDNGNQQKSLAVVARSTGTHWMAASGSKQFANEFSSLGHGVFTYVLLQALKGDAATNKMITVNGLKNFLQIQVPELMKKYSGTLQYPSSYGFGNDFPVEVIK